jgi:hypothetical protein
MTLAFVLYYGLVPLAATGVAWVVIKRSYSKGGRR